MPRGSAALDGYASNRNADRRLSFVSVEPRATRLEITRSGQLKDRAACYHFATQLDGRRCEVAQRRSLRRAISTPLPRPAEDRTSRRAGLAWTSSVAAPLQ